MVGGYGDGFIGHESRLLCDSHDRN
jgi:hypothetical protein